MRGSEAVLLVRTWSRGRQVCSGQVWRHYAASDYDGGVNGCEHESDCVFWKCPCCGAVRRREPAGQGSHQGGYPPIQKGYGQGTGHFLLRQAHSLRTRNIFMIFPYRV